MRLLVSGATSDVLSHAKEHGDKLGVLVVPYARNCPRTIAAMQLPAAADNGAFSGLDVRAFAAMLAVYADAQIPLKWVACPDVVCDAKNTFRLWGVWEKRIRSFGFRPALVLQDGMVLDDLFIFDPPAIFIGGSTEYKFSPCVRKCVEWAKSQGKWVHMGRVNTYRRFLYAHTIGCDSVDGSGFSRWPKRIKLAIKWLTRLQEPQLFTE